MKTNSNMVIVAMAAISIISTGCMIVYGDGDGTHSHGYGDDRGYESPNYSSNNYEFLILDAGWSCSGDYWEFWTYTAVDASYIYVDVANLEDPSRPRTVNFHNYGNYYGYYWEEYKFYAHDDPRCGEAVEVIFYAADYEGNWDQYILYW